MDEGVNHLMDALLALHHATATNHEKQMIRKAGLSNLERDASGGQSKVGGEQALAELLGQELGDTVDAAAVVCQGEGFGDA